MPIIVQKKDKVFFVVFMAAEKPKFANIGSFIFFISLLSVVMKRCGSVWVGQ